MALELLHAFLSDAAMRWLSLNRVSNALIYSVATHMPLILS